MLQENTIYRLKTFSFLSISVNDVKQVINDLNHNKSVGWDTPAIIWK